MSSYPVTTDLRASLQGRRPEPIGRRRRQETELLGQQPTVAGIGSRKGLWDLRRTSNVNKLHVAYV